MNEILCRGQCRQAVFLLAHKSFVILLIAILFATENCLGTVYILIAGQSEF